MMHPAIGGRQSSASTGAFIFQKVASQAPPIVAMSWTAPNGIFKRMVLRSSNPKALTMRGPNVVMPPLGILGQNEQKYRDRRGRMDVRDGDHQREPDPGLWVKERFFNVIPFPLMVFDALLIHPQSAVCQEPKKMQLCRHRLYLSMASSLSSSGRNFALTGESGMKTLAGRC